MILIHFSIQGHTVPGDRYRITRFPNPEVLWLVVVDEAEECVDVVASDRQHRPASQCRSPKRRSTLTIKKQAMISIAGNGR